MLNLHPGQLLLDAAFGIELNSSSSFALRSFPGAVVEICPDLIVSPPLGCHCEGGVCGAITRSQRTQALLDPWAPDFSPGRTGSDAEGGKGPPEEDMIVGGAIPYVLSVALEYMRSLLSHQVLPHRVLQTFIFDVCVFFRRGKGCTSCLCFTRSWSSIPRYRASMPPLTHDVQMRTCVVPQTQQCSVYGSDVLFRCVF